MEKEAVVPVISNLSSRKKHFSQIPPSPAPVDFYLVLINPNGAT
jgi:hypothetical protein